MKGRRGFVVALAGRLVDAAGADPPRFPLSSVDLVRERVREVFRRLRPGLLVSSAACGGDLIALRVAEELEIEAVVILPFEVERFRRSSVNGRPGNWDADYTRAVERARCAGRLEIVPTPADNSDRAAYTAANERILLRALEAGGGPDGVVAIAIWERPPDGGSGLTGRLLADAAKAGVATESISTLAE